MVIFKHSGDFKKTERFMTGALRARFRSIIDKYGKQGVRALESVTPQDTGLTANSWNYEITISNRGYSLKWTNSNLTSSGVPIVILLQYGHGTRGGGYVKGQNFINPAIKPIFDKLSADLWKEVTDL